MFRFRKFNICHPQPREVMVRVVRSEFNELGVESQSLVVVPHSDEHPPIPSPSDYKLSDLMAAGVPLNQVNPAVFDSGPTDAQVEALGKALDDFNSGNIEESDNK